MRILVLAAMLLGRIAVAETWCSCDAGEFTFETTFEGERLPGEFREFDVKLDLDPDDPGDAILRVVVDLHGADMGDPEMNDILFDAQWLAVDKHGEAEFSSDAVTETSTGAYSAVGTLRLKGIERPVTVPFTWERSGESATMQGELELRRTDFDVGTGEWSTEESIGLDVRLAFEVPLGPCE